MKRAVFNLLAALGLCSSLNLQSSSAKAQSMAFSVLTITNPAPAKDSNFGRCVAAVGSGDVLIGAPNDNRGASFAGAAFRFSTDGTLLTTITNPMPAVFDNFGMTIASLGNDRVVIGGRKAAYLFTIDGVLLTAFTNPAPATSGSFGDSVAAWGEAGLLIGASTYSVAGANASGAAHLFSTNGALITTFTNPTPATGDLFGLSLTTVGTDLVVIGAFQDDTNGIDAGAVYLYTTNGTLLFTVTNTLPPFNHHLEYFGISISALGNDRMLIGSYGRDKIQLDVGEAYLFNTNGTLLTTFTNPTPASRDYFGWSVAALGTDRVLVGARYDDAGAADAGAVYVFSTNGTLLTTLTNPTPANGDSFGYSVAAVGNNQILVGAYLDDTGATNAGAAYLFSLTDNTPDAPSLTIHQTLTNTVAVSWNSTASGWTLQENTNNAASVNWSNPSGTVLDDGTSRTLIIDPTTGNRFYRLFKP